MGTLLPVIISLVEAAVQVTPGLITDLQAIFSKPNPTPADWEALRAKVAASNYATLVPDSNIPIGQ